MKKGWKKNQVIITALALMIAVAGYVSYTRSNIDGTAKTDTAMDLSEDNFEISDDPILEGDIFTDTGDGLETAQSTEAGSDVALGENLEGTVENEAAGEAVDAGADAQAVGEENPGEAVLTSSTINNVDFAAEMKLNREQVRAKNKETLLGIVNSANLTDEQKQSAVDQMITLTDIAEREAAAEMLLEAKGFTDVRAVTMLAPYPLPFLPCGRQAASEGEIFALAKTASFVAADPLYKPAVPQGVPFASFPHEACSGRIWRKDIPLFIGQDGDKALSV